MYFRLHSNPDAPCFCAEHAWSGLWGTEFTPDGAQVACGQCQGTGTADVQECARCAHQWDCDIRQCKGGVILGEECHTCDGTGWVDAQRGYSCCSSAEELVAYMNVHGAVGADDLVIIFEGKWVGIGFDGEDRVIPTKILGTTTWRELVARVRQSRA